MYEVSIHFLAYFSKHQTKCAEITIFRQICCQPIDRADSLLREAEHLNNESVILLDSMVAEFILSRLEF